MSKCWRTAVFQLPAPEQYLFPVLRELPVRLLRQQVQLFPAAALRFFCFQLPIQRPEPVQVLWRRLSDGLALPAFGRQRFSYAEDLCGILYRKLLHAENATCKSIKSGKLSEK